MATKTKTTKQAAKRLCVPCKQAGSRIYATERIRFGADRARTYVCAACAADAAEAEQATDPSAEAIERSGYARMVSADLAATTRYAARYLASARLGQRATALGLTADLVTSEALGFVARSLGRAKPDADRYPYGTKMVDRATVRRYAVREAVQRLVDEAAKASDRLASLDGYATDEAKDEALARLARASAEAHYQADRYSVYADADRSRGSGFDAEAIEALTAKQATRLRAFDASAHRYEAPIGRADALRSAARAYVGRVPARAVSSSLAATALGIETLTERPIADPGEASGKAVRPKQRAYPLPMPKPSAHASYVAPMPRTEPSAPSRVSFRALTEAEPTVGALTDEAAKERAKQAAHAALPSTKALREAVRALTEAESIEAAREAASRVRALRASGATTVPVAEPKQATEDKMASNGTGV